MGRRQDFWQLNKRRDVVMQNLDALEKLTDKKSEEAKAKLRQELRDLGDQMDKIFRETENGRKS